MELLLDNDKLIFTYDDLLEGKPLRCRSAGAFEEQHLRKGFTDINRLISAIIEYKRVSKVRADEFALADLIK